MRTELRGIGRSLAAAALGFAVLAGPASAQDFQGLTIMAPAAPGGGYDRTARAVQAALEAEGLASEVTVSNVGGAGGAIGLAQFIDTSTGSGNALIAGGFGMVGSFLTNASAVTLEDVNPIARLTGDYGLVVVPTGSDIQTLADLIERLKADPGGVSWAGGSAGGTDHILAGSIALAAEVDPRLVNYVAFSGGGDALATILGGQVTVGLGSFAELNEQVVAGNLRALGIASPERVEGVDIPTLIEQGVNATLINWRGVMAPPGLSDEQRQAYLTMIDTMVKSDAWQEQLAANGWIDLYLPGDEFVGYIAEETERVRGVLTQLGLIQ
jgi:putative tricarboxylic transport membrane protein